MPASPNLLISPQEKAAASDTQLSQAGLLPRENNEGRREAASEMRTRPLFLRPGGPRLPLQQLAARAVKRRPPGSPALCPSRLGPHPLECTWAHLRARPFVPETPACAITPCMLRAALWQECSLGVAAISQKWGQDSEDPLEAARRSPELAQGTRDSQRQRPNSGGLRL